MPEVLVRKKSSSSNVSVVSPACQTGDVALVVTSNSPGHPYFPSDPTINDPMETHDHDPYLAPDQDPSLTPVNDPPPTPIGTGLNQFRSEVLDLIRTVKDNFVKVQTDALE
ncbi:MAG: hypothetical protein AAGM46_26405 [Cyanobacteria bacterium J06582_2]